VNEYLPVYLAGPDVFLPNSARIGRRKQAICAAHGLDGHYPGDGVDLSTLPPAEHARALFEACVGAFAITVEVAARELGVTQPPER
jgi:nucleoside 2-deoxyribosyltransferase